MAFRMYLESIYNPSTDISAIVEGHADQMLAAEEASLNLLALQKYALALVKLSVLGEHLDDSSFKNAIITDVWDALRFPKTGSRSRKGRRRWHSNFCRPRTECTDYVEMIWQRRRTVSRQWTWTD